MAIKSLRLRIQIWNAAILALVVLGFAVLTYWQQYHFRMRENDRELSAAVEVLTSQLAAIPASDLEAMISSNPDSIEIDPNVIDVWQLLDVPDTFTHRRIRNRFEAPYFMIISPDGRVLKSSASRFERTPPGMVYPPRSATTGMAFRNLGDWREAISKGPANTIILAGRFQGADYGDLRELAWTLTGVGVVLMCVGLIGGWIASGRAVAPIEQITAVAERISGSELSDRIETDSMDREFAGLANTLNQTFDRLESAFRRQSQFTSDASHELRTPLSVMNMHQQLALSKPRSESEYRETIEVCQRATKRMTELVDSLLVLARLDANIHSEFETIDLAEVTRDRIRELQPLADQRRLSIDTELDNSVCVRGDSVQLAQVINNVLNNAIRHSPEGETIDVTLSTSDDQGVLHIIDRGSGIAVEHVNKIFDRFYRIQQDRGREDSGGTGLGLSICQSIMALHEGTISLRSDQGEGCDFEIRFPLTPPPIAEAPHG